MTKSLLIGLILIDMKMVFNEADFLEVLLAVLIPSLFGQLAQNSMFCNQAFSEKATIEIIM